MTYGQGQPFFETLQSRESGAREHSVLMRQIEKDKVRSKEEKTRKAGNGCDESKLLKKDTDGLHSPVQVKGLALPGGGGPGVPVHQGCKVRATRS